MPCRTVIFAGDSVYVYDLVARLTLSLRLLISDSALEGPGYIHR